MKKALCLLSIGLMVCGLLTACSTPQVIVSGRVLSALDETPISSAEVQVKNDPVRTDATGRFQVDAPGNRDCEIVVSAPGWETARLTVATSDEALGIGDLMLSPRTLEGTIQDGTTHEPIAGATIKTDEDWVVADEQGHFVLISPSQGDLSILAPGFDTARLGRSDVNALYDENGIQNKELIYDLMPRSASLQLKDSQGNPVSGALVSFSDRSVTTNADGQCQLDYVDPSTLITITADELRTIETRLDEILELDLVMEPWRAQIIVIDAASNLPIEATVTVNGTEQLVSVEGLTVSVKPGDTISVTSSRYRTTEITYSGEPVWEIPLVSIDLTGTLVDETTGAPISGALVQVYSGTDQPVLARTAGNGSFTVPDVPMAEEVFVKAPGYRTLSVPVTDITDLTLNLEPFEARGIYVPFALLTVPEVITDLLDLVDRTALNSIVVDVRGDWSYIAWPSDNPIAQQVGNYMPDVMSLDDLIKECHSRDIYVIARMVMFKDDIVATTITDWAIKAPADEGGLYYDYEGLTWLDPYRQEVIDYNADLISEVIAFGFDEIQMDYLRFPSDGRAFSLIYSQESDYDTRIAAMERFVAAMYDVVEPSRAFLSADVFGMTPWVDVDFDMGIGQRIEDIAPHVDYVSPMLYPTTFANGSLGYAEPALHAYEVVYESVLQTKERTLTKVRPWLQHYSIFGYVYDTPILLEQRKAAEDAGSCGWIFWNSGAQYNETVMGVDPYTGYPNLPAPPAE